MKHGSQTKDVPGSRSDLAHIVNSELAKVGKTRFDASDDREI